MPSFGVIAAMALATAVPETSTSPGVELSFRAPVGCPTQAEVEAWLAELVPEPRWSEPVRVEVTVEARTEGYGSRMVLDAGSASQTRELEADDCGLLARANVVVIAVGLDPLAVAEATVERAEATSPEPSPAPAPVPAPQPRRPPEPEEPTDRPSRVVSPAAPRPAGDASSRGGGLHYGARIGAGAGGLLLPSAGVGLVLEPWLGPAWLQVRASAQYWTGRRVSFDPQRDAAGVVRLVTGGARVCPVLGRGAVRVPLCAGIDGGAVLGRGTGDALTSSRSAVAPWAGVVLQPGVDIAVARRVSLWAALEGVISLYRPSFSVEGTEGVWTAGAGGLRGLLGIQIHRAREIP